MVVPGIEVLIVDDGLHVPVMALFDIRGKDEGVEPWQNGPTGVKKGGSCGLTKTFIVACV